MTDLVSIVMPAFNSERFIPHSIESVIAQTYANWELLVVDDCSHDNTVNIVQEYCDQDARIQLFTLPTNSGTGVARNRAMDAAKGRFFAFLDSDDLWTASKLERQIDFMVRTSSAVSFTSYLHIDECGSMTGEITRAKENVSLRDITLANYIGNSTSMLDTSRTGQVRCPELRKRQDWGLWYRAITASEQPALGISEPYSCYRSSDGSLSSSKRSLLRYHYQFYRTAVGYGAVRAFASLPLNLVEHQFKKLPLTQSQLNEEQSYS